MSKKQKQHKHTETEQKTICVPQINFTKHKTQKRWINKNFSKNKKYNTKLQKFNAIKARKQLFNSINACVGS